MIDLAYDFNSDYNMESMLIVQNLERFNDWRNA